MRLRFICLISLLLVFACDQSARPLAIVPGTSKVEVLVTNSYYVTVTSNCSENLMACQDVSMEAKNRKTGEVVFAQGRTMYTRCVDRVTACQFNGYEFYDRGYIYALLADGLYLIGQSRDTTIDEEVGFWRRP